MKTKILKWMNVVIVMVFTLSACDNQDEFFDSSAHVEQVKEESSLMKSKVKATSARWSSVKDEYKNRYSWAYNKAGGGNSKMLRNTSFLLDFLLR